ncbi:MAG TPA: M56 family metallopeptidase [Candidatus Acidoferrales bacterium]|nr:M56 family metallopeptidase [Candidatus Acidoferrales bacterium]
MTPALSSIANHLWQSTLCVVAVWLLTLTLKKNRAAVRYQLWLAASLKFVIPFSLFVRAGNWLGWSVIPASAQPRWSFTVVEIGRPFATHAPIEHAAMPPTNPSVIPAVLFGVWLAGFAACIALWVRRWWQMRAIRVGATPSTLPLPIPALCSSFLNEPCVFGIFRPVLLLPEAIIDRLTPIQLDAILAHELCHVRRRDNLTAAVHMVIEAAFWFYPVVRWIGLHLLEERERACDEAVLQLCTETEAYAEAILKVCNFYVESPLVCVSGVAGSNLKKRIVRILAQSRARRLGAVRKLLLSAAAIAAIAGPVIFGLLTAKQTRAASQNQNAVAAPVIKEVSVKPEPPPDPDPMVLHMVHFGLTPSGTFTAEGFTLRMLIQEAYGVESDQVSGGPDWLSSEKFDLEAKLAPGNPAAPRPSLNQMELFNQQVMQPILANRFKLSVHREIRYLPVYALTVAEGGSKLHEATPGDTYPNGVTFSDGKPAGGPIVQMLPGKLIGQELPVWFLAHVLSGQLDHMVLDRTGLTSNYDFTLKWTPAPSQPMRGIDGSPAPPPADAFAPDPSGPSIFDAIQDQLGLRLGLQQAPVNVIVIDHAEEP